MDYPNVRVKVAKYNTFGDRIVRFLETVINKVSMISSSIVMAVK